MKKILVAILFALSMAGLHAATYTLDWTAVDYTASSQDETFSNVDGSGVDMNFKWVDGPNPPGLGLFSTGLPDDEDGLQALFPSAEPGLWYATTQGGDVSLVMEFSDLVTNVSFGIYDIDGESYDLESVRVKAFDENGDAVDIMNYWASFDSSYIDLKTQNAAGTISGTDWGYHFINMANPDPDPGDAGWENNMAIIGIDSNVQIKKVALAFLNNDGARGQILTDVSFDYIPEPASMLLMGLGSVALLKRRR